MDPNPGAPAPATADRGTRLVVNGDLLDWHEGMTVRDVLKAKNQSMNSNIPFWRAHSCEAAAELFELALETGITADVAMFALFKFAHDEMNPYLASGGFKQDYRDPANSDQVHHALIAVSVEYLVGRGDEMKTLAAASGLAFSEVFSPPVEWEDVRLDYGFVPVSFFVGSFFYGPADLGNMFRDQICDDSGTCSAK